MRNLLLLLYLLARFRSKAPERNGKKGRLGLKGKRAVIRKKGKEGRDEEIAYSSA